MVRTNRTRRVTFALVLLIGGCDREDHSDQVPVRAADGDPGSTSEGAPASGSAGSAAHPAGMQRSGETRGPGIGGGPADGGLSRPPSPPVNTDTGDRDAGTPPIADPLDAGMAADTSALGTAPAFAWSSARLVADVELPLTLDVAIGADGNAVAAWDQANAANTDVRASYYSAATGSWGAPTQMDPGASLVKTTGAQVGLDAQGDGVVLWHREPEEFVTAVVWGNRYDAHAGAWGQAQRVSSGYGMMPELIVEPDGSASAVWVAMDGLSIALMHSSYDVANANWSAASRLDQGRGVVAAALQLVATAPEGDAVVAWTQGDLLTGIVTAHARHKSSGSTSWGPPEQFARDATMTGNTTLIATDVALNDAGTTFVVWQDSESDSTTTVWTSRYDERTRMWGEVQRLGHEEMENAKLPQVVVDAVGNAIAIWTGYNGRFHSVWVNHYSAATGRWGTAESLASELDATSTDPQVGVDGDGNAVVIWSKQAPEGQTIWTRRYSVADASWGSAARIDLGDNLESYSHRLAVAPSGEALLIWAGEVRGVYANHYTQQGRSAVRTSD